MTIYDFDSNELDFDFYSTEPPVFRITVASRRDHNGMFAEALFRGGHHSHLWSVTAWGRTADEALATLLDELRTRYVKVQIHLPAWPSVS